MSSSCKGGRRRALYRQRRQPSLMSARGKMARDFVRITAGFSVARRTGSCCGVQGFTGKFQSPCPGFGGAYKHPWVHTRTHASMYARTQSQVHRQARTRLQEFEHGGDDELQQDEVGQDYEDGKEEDARHLRRTCPLARHDIGALSCQTEFPPNTISISLWTVDRWQCQYR